MGRLSALSVASLAVGLQLELNRKWRGYLPCKRIAASSEKSLMFIFIQSAMEQLLRAFPNAYTRILEQRGKGLS